MTQPTDAEHGENEEVYSTTQVLQSEKTLNSNVEHNAFLSKTPTRCCRFNDRQKRTFCLSRTRLWTDRKRLYFYAICF